MTFYKPYNGDEKCQSKININGHPNSRSLVNCNNKATWNVGHRLRCDFHFEKWAKKHEINPSKQ